MAQNTSTAVMARRAEPAEIWRPVDGWPGYEVSSWGRVRSWKWPGAKRQWSVDRDRGARILRSCTRNKYPSVLLSDKDVGRKWFSVHVLVLATFVGSRPEGCQAAHGDGDPTNNLLSNLRWCTPSENNRDKVGHGTTLHGEQIGTSKLTAGQVSQIRTRRKSGERICDLAAEYGVCRNTITNITTGKTWIPPCRKRLERPGDYDDGEGD